MNMKTGMKTRENLIKEIEAFAPFNEQEERDKVVILDYLRTHEDAFLRTNMIAHMTASAWVVNAKRDRILMAYHNIYKSWSWLGGHADGDEDLLAVALREVCEESGITSVKPVSEDIFSLEVLTVDGHEKRGQYVPSHLHLNITYLIEANDSEATSIKADENSDVAWFTLDGAIEASCEEWFKERIYSKLNMKLS